MFRASASWPLALATALLLSAGCDVNVQDGVGPRKPTPDVEGRVSRGASPAVNLDVELRNIATDTKMFETESDIRGGFGFAGVPAGLWELRVEGAQVGDFASVSRQFYRGDGDGQRRLGAMDVFAYGAGPVDPADGATRAVPTPFDPLDFRWSPPGGAIARVQLRDLSGRDVWNSPRVIADSVRWNGYGTEGAYQGVQVGAGLYEWRVRFELPDTSEARTARRWLRFE